MHEGLVDFFFRHGKKSLHLLLENDKCPTQSEVDLNAQGSNLPFISIASGSLTKFL